MEKIMNKMIHHCFTLKP